DNERRITRVEAIEQPLDSPGLHDDVAKVLSCARLPGAELEHGISQTTVDQVVLKAALILEVSLRTAIRHLVERRLCAVEVSLLDKLRHLTVEERQQQRADVRAVGVGVRYDDDRVGPEL